MISGGATYAVMLWALAQASAPPASGAEPVQAEPAQTTPAESAAQTAPAEPPPAEAVPAEAAPVDTTRTQQGQADDTVTPDTAPLPATPEQEASAEPAVTEENKVALGSRKPKPTPKRKLRRPNTVTFNGVRAAFGVYSAALERALSSHISIVLEPSFVSRTFATTRGTTTARGFGFAAGARYFPFGAAPDGLYVSPEITTYNLNVVEAVGRANGTSIGATAWAGYNHTFFNLLHLSAGVGAQVTFGPVAPEGILYRDWSVVPVFRLSAGFRF